VRQLFLATVATVALAGLTAGPALAGSVEIKDVHLCCGQCVKAVAKVLAKVDGVSGPKCDQGSKTVTFTAKDSAAAASGLKALLDAGFFGAATEDGKPVKVAVATPAKGQKAAEVTVTQVHVCCGQCRKIITALFKDAKVDFPGAGEVKVGGKDLDKADVLQTLRKAGFNGSIAN
jgi:hypothetical protein